jgi:hypothetical protein
MIWFLSSLAFARPTSGGTFSFSSEDVIETYDLDMIRVHYSVEGPSLVLQGDEDLDGTPDYVQLVAEKANEVLEFYAEEGFRYPISEEEMGLSNLGGTTAFDFYLIDFGGNSDGMFGVDDCSASVCSGYMVMENDFQGYGYPSIEEAVKVLTSHELFHAVQAAYNGNQPTWLSEGSAVWAEWLYDPEMNDFYWFAKAFLQETERSIHKPPVGVATSFVYGTALFYAFMDEYFGEVRMVSVQESLEGVAEEEVIEVLLDHLDNVEEDWLAFTRWNLATGANAGAIESYTFARNIYGIPIEAEGETISENHRFYPLAASYFKIEHPGGEMSFVYQDEEEDVTFSLHPTNEDKRVTEAVKVWTIGEEAQFSLDLEAGDYWLIGTLPKLTNNSQKIDFCIGVDCVIPVEETVEPSNEEDKKGCQSVGFSASLWFFWGILGLRRRDKG